MRMARMHVGSIHSTMLMNKIRPILVPDGLSPRAFTPETTE